jgi:hypothetical protein
MMRSKVQYPRDRAPDILYTPGGGEVGGGGEPEMDMRFTKPHRFILQNQREAKRKRNAGQVVLAPPVFKMLLINVDTPKLSSKT